VGPNPLPPSLEARGRGSESEQRDMRGATTLAGFIPDPTVNFIAAATQFFFFDNPRLP
jgi:hypothetical protein